jgi:hypothetical protein
MGCRCAFELSADGSGCWDGPGEIASLRTKGRPQLGCLENSQAILHSTAWRLEVAGSNVVSFKLPLLFVAVLGYSPFMSLSGYVTY